MQERKVLFHATGDDAFLQADHFYFAPFTTLNGSGVTGGAVLAVDDETHTLTVAIAADGLEPNQVHIQHIHGFPDDIKDAKTPTAAQDDDRDGFIELAEGLETYGPILLNLSVNHEAGAGGDNGHSHTSGVTGFPTAPNEEIFYVQSFQLPTPELGTDSMTGFQLDWEPLLDLREIVIHGMTVPEGAGDGTPGDVNGVGEYKLVLPVASGEISEVGSVGDLRAFVKEIELRDFSSHHEWMIG